MAKDTEERERESSLERVPQRDPFKTPEAMREDMELEDDELWEPTLP